MNNLWYGGNKLFYGLLPLTFIYRIIIFIRRFLFHIGIKKTYRLKVPVIVVGNITVGGTGKTPLIIWLANWLKAQDYRPGIVSRGYGGKPQRYPECVSVHSSPKQVGDEPLLIAKKTKCPVMVHPNRVMAANRLIEKFDCNIILSDDGLQHYSLFRDIEIIVIDGMRRFGNQYCLPAGPLREPLSRINHSDFIIVNGEKINSKEYEMSLETNNIICVANPSQEKTLEEIKDQTIHAIAGIGNPNRYFSFLKNLGLKIIEHAFPDHYFYSFKDIDFGLDQLVLMTEKDAIKCQSFADHRHWCLPITIKPDAFFISSLQTKIQSLR